MPEVELEEGHAERFPVDRWLLLVTALIPVLFVAAFLMV